MSLLRAYLEHGADFLCWLQLGVVTEVRIWGCLVPYARDLYLIEVEGVGDHTVEFIRDLCLDELFEVRDTFLPFNLNRKGSNKRLAAHKAEETNRS